MPGYLIMDIFDLYALYQRSRHEPNEIIEQIESDGGQVLERRLVSRIVPSPFRNLRPFPLLYEFRVRYPDRNGSWFIRTTPGGMAEWVWMDDDGYDSLPIPGIDAGTARDLQPISYRRDAVITLGLIGGGLAACIAIYWHFF